jgi:H+-transporting ATPase
VAVVLGVAMVGEALLLLRLAWTPFGLGAAHGTLHTFSFLLLLFLAVFSVVSVRERGRFWATRPSWTLSAALSVEAVVGAVVALVGLPGLPPLPGWQVLAVIGYTAVTSLVVNDAVKVAMIRWRVPSAAA